MQPHYSRKERLVDGVIHGLGVVGSLIAVAVLLVVVIPTRDVLAILAAGVYGAGLIAMLWLSAAYNLVDHPDWKERFRRYDHAAIFLMIASTYTPFALVTIGGRIGHGLLAIVWLLATGGMALKIGWSGRLERASVIMYLALRWAGLPAVGLLLAALPPVTLALLGAGGVLYTVGIGFHLWENLPYQNAIWHGFVLVAAVCHFASVLETHSG